MSFAYTHMGGTYDVNIQWNQHKATEIPFFTLHKAVVPP